MTKDYLSYSKENTKKYSDLVTKSTSPFCKKTMADVFLFAAALAIKRGLPPTKLKTRADNIPISAFGEQEWLLNAIAIVEVKDNKILFKEKKVIYGVVEEYANTGIDFLYKEVFETEGDFLKKIELECRIKDE